MRKTTARLILIGDFIFNEISRYLTLWNDNDYMFVGIIWFLGILGGVITAFVTTCVYYNPPPNNTQIAPMWILINPSICIGVALLTNIIAYIVDTARRFTVYHNRVMPKYREELKKIIAAPVVIPSEEEKGQLSIVERKQSNESVN